MCFESARMKKRVFKRLSSPLELDLQGKFQSLVRGMYAGAAAEIFEL
jgi:hypothetical protein